VSGAASPARRAAGLALAAARALRVGRLARLLLRPLPRRYAVALEGRIYRLRQRSGDHMAHVAADELEARFTQALAFVADGGREVGDYLEFGVYVGATMTCFDRARRAAGVDGVRLVGFDSFAGMPPEAATEGAGFSLPGLFSASVDEARANLRSGGVDLARVELVEGWFSETLTAQTRERLGLQRAGVVMIDCDLCSSARAALEFTAPLIDDRAVVFLDDWGHGGPDGEQRAWREFLAAHPELRGDPLGSYRAGGHPDGGRVFLLRHAV
jgi:O-methyltransferase